MPFTHIDNAIAAIQRGELVVVVDDADRENEGDLIMAAEKVTPETMAFMIRHTSGVICMPMLGEHLYDLRLPLMPVFEVVAGLVGKSIGRMSQPTKVGESFGRAVVWEFVHWNSKEVRTNSIDLLAFPGHKSLLGPTGGYLLSYPLAAFVTGWLAERGFDRRYLTSVLAMAAGLAVIFACGVTWLAWFARPAAAGFDAALRTGFLAFLPVDIYKILVAATILPAMWKLTGQR